MQPGGSRLYRMMVHTADAVQQGLIFVLRTVDTDVVVMAGAAVPRLHNTQYTAIASLWS